MSIDTIFLRRGLDAPGLARGTIQERRTSGDSACDLYRAACCASNRHANRLPFKDLIRHVTKHGLIEADAATRWPASRHSKTLRRATTEQPLPKLPRPCRRPSSPTRRPRPQRLRRRRMFLRHIDIRYFRGIEHLSLPVDELCVLIGENNTGKSSILDAVRLCLTRSLAGRGNVFNQYDYHLPDASADPANAHPIRIQLTFGERKKGEWRPELLQTLSDVVQIDADGLNSVILRVTSRFNRGLNDYATDYDFLDFSETPLVKAKNLRQLSIFQRLVPTFYLASLRDAAQEFRARSKFWGPFVRSLELDDDARAELEAALVALNDRVLAQHTAFDSVMDRLLHTATILPLGGDHPVSIEAIPSKVFDILSRTQVHLASNTGAHIPIVRHGSGTQSLAVICLFDAFLRSRLNEDYGKYAEPLLALEEPEAHLHPSAIKAVGEMLHQLSGQKLISTHSGDLLAGIPLRSIRRLRWHNGEIQVHRLEDDALSRNDQARLDYHIRASRGGFFFSRCWLLVEGATEPPLISACARALGHDLYAQGVSCIEYAQVGVRQLITLADQLGIEWLVLADKDPAGEKYAKSARCHLGERREEDHIRLLEHGSLEVFLCTVGFGDFYGASISEQKRGDVTARRDTPEYWKQVAGAQSSGAKRRNARRVAERIVGSGGSLVPTLLQDVIAQALTLARSGG